MKVPHRITRLVLIGLAVLALAAPAASARPVSPDLTPAERVVIEPEPVVQIVDNGFDWDSAAVGAGVAGALLLLVSLGGVTYRRRHDDVRVAR